MVIRKRMGIQERHEGNIFQDIDKSDDNDGSDDDQEERKKNKCKRKRLNEAVKDMEITLYMLKDNQTTSNLSQGFLTFPETRAFVCDRLEPLSEPKRTLNRKLHQQNKRVPSKRRNERPEYPRVIYPPVLDINHFRHFLNILKIHNLMDDEPMWAADRVVAPTPGPTITIPKTANEFAIKGNHLTLVKGNQFDGTIKTYPHKHIHEFLGVCDMLKYEETENEVIRLMMFPLSLTGEAKTSLDELNEGTIES
ncbi:hypothetical protein Tco_0250376 [Tanacetum coccineum]